MSRAKDLVKGVYFSTTHLLGRVSGKYYFEDFVRVYPEQMAYNRFGIRHKANRLERNNYLNHCKFYGFVGQFVQGKAVADVGCGSGYGCDILKRKGASKLYGCDISKHALRFAQRRYGSFVTLSEQGITDLHGYKDNMFDVTISSEVLEHIKEYGMEDKAVAELKRVTRPGGLVIVGTPNSELQGDHGFYFEEMDALFRRHFSEFRIFENALVPYGPGIDHWNRRKTSGETGVIVTEKIAFDETVLPDGVEPEVKQGLEPGTYLMGELAIDTTLLHNTHSWVVIARK